MRNILGRITIKIWYSDSFGSGASKECEMRLEENTINAHKVQEISISKEKQKSTAIDVRNSVVFCVRSGYSISCYVSACEQAKYVSIIAFVVVERLMR